MLLHLKTFVFIIALFMLGYGIAWWGAGRELRRLMGPRFVACFAMIIFAGLFAPRLPIYLAVMVIAVLATTRDREDLACRYVVMIGLLPAVNMSLVVGGLFLGGYQSTALLSLVMLVAVPFRRDLPGAPRRPVPGFRVEDMVVVALFLIHSLGASHFGSFTIFLRKAVLAAADFLLPYLILRRNVRSQEELHRMVGCLAFSALPVAVIAIFEARRGWPLFDAIPARLSMAYGMSASVVQRGGALRAMAAFSGPLVLAYFLLLGLLAWVCSRRLFAKRAAWTSGLFVLLVAMQAPQSRGVLLAAVPALAVLLVARRRFAAAAGLIGAAGLGGATLYVLQHSSAAVAAFVGGNRVGIYYDYRGLLLHRGLQEGMHHWLAGQSHDAVIASLQDITQGEHIVDLVNAYLTIFLYSGVLGFFPFVIGSLLVFRKLVARAPRHAGQEAMRDNRAFLLALFVGTYVFLWSAGLGERLIVYEVMLLAMARLCSESLVRRPRPATLAMVPPPAEGRADRQSQFAPA